MKLYYAPGACSLSPHIVAREAGIELTLVKVDLKTKKTEAGADYLAVNPNGYVPALELDGGEVLCEGPAVVQYLADSKPAAGLVPANGTLERYRVQQWLNFINAELHKAMGSLFNPATVAEQRPVVVEQLAKRFDYVAKSLAGKPYVFGEKFSVVDAYLYTVLNWTGVLKIDLSRWPVLQEYLGRVAARPAVQQSLREEGLLKS